MRCLLIEGRAKNARRHRVSDAKPLLQNPTEAMGVFKCKASASDRRPSLVKGILYRKALRTVSDR